MLPSKVCLVESKVSIGPQVPLSETPLFKTHLLHYPVPSYSSHASSSSTLSSSTLSSSTRCKSQPDDKNMKPSLHPCRFPFQTSSSSSSSLSLSSSSSSSSSLFSSSSKKALITPPCSTRNATIHGSLALPCPSPHPHASTDSASSAHTQTCFYCNGALQSRITDAPLTIFVTCMSSASINGISIGIEYCLLFCSRICLMEWYDGHFHRQANKRCSEVADILFHFKPDHD